MKLSEVMAQTQESPKRMKLSEVMAAPSEPQQVETEEAPMGLLERIDQVILDTPGGKQLTELATAANKSVFQVLDFFGPDQANAVLELLGAQGRVPTLTENFASDGNVMDEGIGRDIIQTAGQALPIALGIGQALRAGAGKLSAVTEATESAAKGTLRQAGAGTPKADIQAAGLSAIGAEVGEEVGGADGRLIGSGLAPFAAAVPSVAKEAVKAPFRGKGTAEIAKAVDDFAEVGSTPTLGQATGSKFQQAVENRSSQVFGGGAIARSLEKTTEAMKSRLTQIADDVSPVRGEVEAGRVIQKGIIGDDGFVSRFQTKSGSLWSKVDKKIPETARSPVENTRAALNDLVRNDSFGAALNNPKLAQVKNIFNNVLGQTKINQTTQTRETVTDIPYKDLASLRRHIGEMLGSKDLISDVPRAQLKRLYASLSEDIKAVAADNGALAAFNRANVFTSAGHTRLDDFVARVANKVDLDKVFQAMARGGDGVQSLNAIKRSLKPEEWEAVGANVIRRLGEATNGQQDSIGDVFSVPKFLTDWNKLGASKSVLFSGSPKLNEYAKNMDKIARVADRVKESLREGANPSGTGQLVANVSLGTGAVTGAVTGNWLAVAGVLGTIVTNKSASTLLTSPKFVQWLASAGTNKDLPAHIARLEAIAVGSGIGDEVLQLLEELKTTSQQKESQP